MTCALSVGATSLGVTDVDLQRFVRALTDTGQITPDEELVTSTPAVQAFVDARAAYGFNDLFGLTAHARVLYGEAAQRSSSDRWSTMFGLMLDINPSQRWGAPVGFGIGIKTDNNPRGGNESGKRTTTIFGRVGYLGTRDFDLGLDIAYTRIPLQSLPERHVFISAVIDMRLVF